MAASDNQKRQGSGQGRTSSASKQTANARAVAQGRPVNQPRTAVRKQSVPLYFYGLLLLLVIVGGLILYSFISGSNQRQAGDAPLTAQQVMDKGISRGNASAKLVVVEFGDFQCPGCYDFFTSLEPSFKAQYVDTNRVLQVWVDYPLPQHEKAMKAAEAGRCANEQGKFWEMHDQLYANQDAWINGDENALWKQYATSIGIDGDKLLACVTANKYDAQIQDAISVGKQEKVSATPSFLINHTLLVLSTPDDLDKAIAAESKR